MDDININKASEHRPATGDDNYPDRVKILIVEDDAVIAMDLQRRLEIMGYHVTSIAASGEEAVLMTQEKKPDLVLMDIALSGKTGGTEAAGRIRSASNVPVIYLTAHSDEETLKHAILTGPYGYLIKPVGNTELHKTIESALIKHRTDRQLKSVVSKAPDEENSPELSAAAELLQNKIMEHRSAEEALRESEKRYRELFNYMTSGITVYEAAENGNDFIIKDFNRAGESIDKIRKEDIIGEKVTSVFPGVRESGILDVFKRVWETGETERHANWHYEDHRISGWRDNHIYRLSTGEIISVYNDVTDQVILAERESALLRELQTIFDNFPVGIVYLDDKYRIISTNRFFNEFTGSREGALTGKTCYESVGEYADDPAKSGLEKVCSFCKKDECNTLKKPVSMERPLGDKFIRVTTIPEFNDSGNIFRYMEIVEDITDRKRAEAEAVRASHLAALGELAAGVAHEINNPINGIINYTQILLNWSSEGDKEHDIARRIIKEGDRIANIVRNLLSFAWDDKGDKMPASISDILSEALGLTEVQLRKDGIMIILDIPPALPSVTVQSLHLEQVFLNIISNARYALNSKYEGVHEDKILEILVKEVAIGMRPYIHIVFHDRGTGIRPDILDKVMNPFFSTKPGGTGTGLGLSISHGIVSNHGGRLLIDSVEGVFTKIIVELPVRN
jgi:PAS domain S-box-containing protein